MGKVWEGVPLSGSSKAVSAAPGDSTATDPEDATEPEPERQAGCSESEETEETFLNLTAHFRHPSTSTPTPIILHLEQQGAVQIITAECNDFCPAARPCAASGE